MAAVATPDELAVWLVEPVAVDLAEAVLNAANQLISEVPGADTATPGTIKDIEIQVAARYLANRTGAVQIMDGPHMVSYGQAAPFRGMFLTSAEKSRLSAGVVSGLSSIKVRAPEGVRRAAGVPYVQQDWVPDGWE